MNRVMMTALACVLPLAAPAFGAEDDGFTPIFDGKTLNGWDGDPEHWSVQDGAIVGQATVAQAMKSNTFLIWRQGEVDDFEFKAEFRIDGGNSGIQYRSFENVKDWGRWVIGGYQADMDAANQWTGGLYAERDRGVLAAPGDNAVVDKSHKPRVTDHVAQKDAIQKILRADGWNEYHIIARGFHFTHKINATTSAELTDDDAAVRRRGGLLALQLHAGFDMKVQFRNLRLKRLPLENARKVVFVSGPASHGYGEHEHYAGCLLLAKALNENTKDVYATVYRNGWPVDPTAFENANAVVVYADGGDGSLFIQHREEMDKLAKRGVGLVCLHYAVETPKGDTGDAMLRWIGGYFELFWSVNPFWIPNFAKLPDHEITRGVRPFSIRDEWYYNMRFAGDRRGVTPILAAVPPDETRAGKDGPRSGNASVRANRGGSEIVAWAFDRSAIGGKGRGFGFTGSHVHWNWGQDDFRRTVLNAIVWTAGAHVPASGVNSKTPSLEDLEANQDEPQPKTFDRDAMRRRLDAANHPMAAGH